MAFRGIQSTNIISTEVGFTDPVLVLNKDGSTAVDVGFLGKIGSTSYAGLVKDSTTEDFLLIKSISINSSSINDIDATDLSLVKGDLVVDTVTGDLIGDVTGQVSDISNFNTDSLSEGSTNLYYTDARVDARAQLKIDAIVDSSPGTLDTLNELAAALGDDANFSTTVTNSIAAKLPLAGGTLTGDLEVLKSGGGKIRISETTDKYVEIIGYAEGTANGSTMAFHTNQSGTSTSTERMRIDHNGNAGIGTNSPGAKLSVDGPAALANLGGGSTGSAALYVNSTSGHVGEMIQVLKNGAIKMYMANDGKLGLGTSSPTRELDVNGSVRFSVNTDNHDTYIFTTGAVDDGKMYIQDANSVNKVVLNTNGDSYFDGGNFGIGITSPTEKLHVSGNILASGDITAYSDDSLKTNVQVIDNAVGKVEQLRGVTFDRIEDGSTSTGVIAQELKEVLPEAVHTDEQGVHSVAYGNVVGLLIEAIKEQQKQIDELIKANKS